MKAAISQADFARLSGLTPKLISTIVNGTNPVSADTAIRFERVLGLKAYIWTSIQAKWDLFQARAAAAKLVPKPKEWLSQFPVKKLHARGYLPDTRDVDRQIEALLGFFNIGTPRAFIAKVGAPAVHHRQSEAHESSEQHVFTWLMIGEWRARAMNPPPFHAGKFREAVCEIRKLTTEAPRTFEPAIKELYYKAVRRFVLEPPISKTCLFGSAHWFDVDRAIIQMSLRMKTNDHFWWTFFHEAAHISRHQGKNFADDKNGEGDGAEQEADDGRRTFSSALSDLRLTAPSPR